MDSWSRVRDYALLLGTDGEQIIRESQRRKMSAEQVEEAYGRADALARKRREGPVPFTEFAARPPGFIDIRVVDQTQWWVDVMRTPHRLAEVDDVYLNNLVAFLIEHAAWFRCAYLRAYPSSEPAASADSWLEGTALMRALRYEQRRRWTEHGIPTTQEIPSQELPADD